MPDWLTIILIVMAANWGLPLLSWAYPLVAWLLLRDLYFDGFHRGAVKFCLLGDRRVYWKGPEYIGTYVIKGKDGPDYIVALEGDTEPLIAPTSEIDFMEPWHAKLWRDWGGVGLFGFMVYRDRPAAWDDEWVERTIAHEYIHVVQALVLGLFHVVLYLGHMLFIYLFQKDKHPYLDCWAERMARARAGQKVDIPRHEWPQGPNDRWPWW